MFSVLQWFLNALLEKETLTCLGRQLSRNGLNCETHPTIHQDTIKIWSKIACIPLGILFKIVLIAFISFK